jgi:CCDC81-like prokaryotic HU domain 1/CCDC81-like prokaryotic HU domain 2/SPOR domain
MTPISSYLKKLLHQYDCVVVPELGGFLTHYLPASFSEATSQYLPPRRKLAFNEALRLDDGILLNYVMLHEAISRDEAQRQIALFVAELRQALKQTGSFSVEGVGLFSPNDEGKLQFDPELRHNFHGEAYGLGAVPAERVQRKAIAVVTVEAEPETANESVRSMAIGPVLVKNEDTQIMPLYPAQRRQLPGYVRWAAAALLVSGLGALSYVTVLEPGAPFQSSLNPANLLQLAGLADQWGRFQASMITPEKQETKAVANVQPMQKAMPVVVAETSLPTATPTAPVSEPAVVPVIAKSTPVVKPVAVVSSVVVLAPAAPVAKPSLPKKAVVLVDESPADDAATVAAPPADAPGFVVVAGSFASRQNALRFEKKLETSGYGDAYIIRPGYQGKLYKVVATGLGDKNLALATADSLHKTTGIQAWIFRAK